MAPKDSISGVVSAPSKRTANPVSSKTLDAPGLRVFSYDEITATEDDRSQFLTVIRGNVYDLRDFWQSHPGGSDVIGVAAGRDASVLFESYHQAGAAMKRLESFQVGVCKDSKVPAQQDVSFWNTINKRIADYLVQNKTTRQLTWLSLTELIVTLMVFATSWYFSAVHKLWLGAIVLGFCYGRLGFLMHMGIHRAAASRSMCWLNQIHGAAMDLIGGSSCIWKFEHNVAHHCYPNELHTDNDCEIGFPMYRFHPGLKRRWWHSIQVVTVLLGMTMGLIKWVASDLINWLTGRVGNLKCHFTRAEVAQMLFFKSSFMLLHFVIPWYIHGEWSTIFRNFFTTLILGAEYLENIFITNHIQKDCVPDAHRHWSDQQVQSTVNWGAGSAFWNWFSGGLNHQIEHHLFPSLAYYHYAAVSPIVRQTCAEFGLPYRSFDTLPEAMLSCYRYLHELGNSDAIKAA